MQDPGFYRRLFEFDNWANKEMLAVMRRDGTPGNTLALMSHLAAAQRLWYARVQRSREEIVVWPRFTLQQCAAQLAEYSRMWQGYVDGTSAEALESTVAYTNTKGDRYEDTVADIMTHVISHAAYHRGQVAAEIRAAGISPPATDFIVAARDRHLR